jgi:hypothetical protein
MEIAMPPFKKFNPTTFNRKSQSLQLKLEHEFIRCGYDRDRVVPVIKHPTTKSVCVGKAVVVGEKGVG